MSTCAVCIAKPGSHCFLKIGSASDINIYYCSPARSSDFMNATAISSHLVNVLEENKKCIWIFDCKGLSPKHAMQIDTIKNLIGLLSNPKYGENIVRFIAINMSKSAQNLLDMILPLLTREARENIDKCGSYPIEIMTCLQKYSLGVDILRWVNKTVVLEVNEELPGF